MPRSCRVDAPFLVEGLSVQDKQEGKQQWQELRL